MSRTLDTEIEKSLLLESQCFLVSVSNLEAGVAQSHKDLNLPFYTPQI